MEKIRVLLADDKLSISGQLDKYLARTGEIEIVGKIYDGADVLDAIRADVPDVIVMDMILPHRDGFTLLESIRELPGAARPRVIVLTSLARDDLILRAMRLGADYYMVKPFDPGVLQRRIIETARQREVETASQPREEAKETSEDLITNLFLTLGIPAHIKGYQYLREAVSMVIEDNSVIGRITKQLYPGVAEKFSTTAGKVERAMRHAIEVAWNRGRLDTVNRMYGYRLFEKQDKPSNGEFIALVADKISMRRSA